MKSVAIIGGAKTTRGGIARSTADEFWTMNWSYNYGWIPRIDRLFEMHKMWLFAKSTKQEYVKPRKHWKWLTEKPHEYPIYMLQYFEGVDNCVAYPIEEVTSELFAGLLLRGDAAHDFFTSSADYMLALAIVEGFERIELYGVEMRGGTEYRYQREGCAFFIGQAIARGIEVWRPSNSVLLRNGRYGYDNSQMILRQDLERLLEHWTKEKRNEMSRLQNMEGRMQQLSKNTKDVDTLDKELQAMAGEYQEQRDRAITAAANVQCFSYLIAEIDMEEPVLELVTPFERVGMGKVDAEL